MLKKRIIIVLIFTSLNLFSQINFKEGYFINNNGKKIICLIENTDNVENLKDLKYKLPNNSTVYKENINNLTEFSIYKKYRYKKFNVKIDVSDLSKTSKTRAPNYKERSIFLKYIVQSNANLLLFKQNNIEKFFYQIGNETPIQLEYKKYLINETRVMENRNYLVQIKRILNCDGLNNFNVKYTLNNLKKYFIKYNDCKYDKKSITYSKKSSVEFNLSLRPGVSLNITSLDFNKFIPYSIPNGTRRENGKVKTENSITLRFGIELEFILPKTNKKWAFILEPTYFEYEAPEKERDLIFEGGSSESSKSKYEYSGISFPIGLRHYMYLNKKSKFFANVNYNFNSLYFTNMVRHANTNYEIDNVSFFDFGGGYKYKDKFSFELKYIPNINLRKGYLGDVSLKKINFSSIQFILGYTIF